MESLLYHEKIRKRERERQTNRQKERERERDRQTDREKEKERGRERHIYYNIRRLPHKFDILWKNQHFGTK